MNNGSLASSFLNKRTFGLLSLVVMVLALNWLRTHTILSINVADTGEVNSSVSYTLRNQTSGEVTNIKSTDTHITRVLAKADYEVVVTQAERSYFALTQTKSFLRSTAIDVKLQPEKQRAFVGNEPGPCMYYTDVLYSYECGGEAASFKVHLPATPTDPTTANAAAIEGMITEGIAAFQSQSYMLAQVYTGDDAATQHKLFPLSQDLALTSPLTLSDLNPDKSYSVLNADMGVVMHDAEFRDVKVYSDPAAAPKKLDLDRPYSVEAKTPASLSATDSTVGLLYNNQSSEGDKGNTDLAYLSNELQNGESEFIVQKPGSEARHYSFDHLYTSGILCGDQKVCLLSGSVLQIFDVSGDKAKLLQQILKVQTMQYRNKTIYIVNDKGVIALNQKNLSGAFAYSFGDYTYCGGLTVQPDGSFLLCVTNPKGDSSALRVDGTNDNTDSIDKKILKLSQSRSVTSVSAYRNIIFTVPFRGDLNYDPNLPGYTYSAAVIQSSNADISDLVEKLGISKDSYQIISTYQ
jgi:hypothetical protein